MNTKKEKEELLLQGLKKCALCKDIKSIEEFNADKSRKDGLYPYCKACNFKITKEWKKSNPDKRKAYEKKWRDENRQKLTEYNRVYKREQRKRQKENKQ